MTSNELFEIIIVKIQYMTKEDSRSSSQDYIVERILKKRIRNGKAEYRVKWQGYSIRESTWEPIQHLNSVLYMVDKFDSKKSSKNRVHRPGSLESQGSNASPKRDEGSQQLTKRINKSKKVGSSSTEPKNVRHYKRHSKESDSSNSQSPQHQQKQKKNEKQKGEIKRRHRESTSNENYDNRKSDESQSKDSDQSSKVRHLSVSSSSVEVAENKYRKSRQVNRVSSSESQNRRNDKSRTNSKESVQKAKSGSYKQGDRVKHILDVRKDIQEKKVEFQVSWKKRRDGKNPSPSWVTDRILIECDSEMLCQFLLGKIKWPKNDK